MIEKIEFYKDGSIKSVVFADGASIYDTEFWLRVVHNWSGNRGEALKLMHDRIAPAQATR